MEDNSLAEDFPPAQSLRRFSSPWLQTMALHFLALSGEHQRSVPQVAYSWNSDLINQIRGNLMRGSCLPNE